MNTWWTGGQDVKMASGWSTEETRALISVWGEANVQDQLDSVKRNKDIYERISAQLSAQGWTKSWKQCRVKVKNLTQRYRKVSLIVPYVYVYIILLTVKMGI